MQAIWDAVLHAFGTMPDWLGAVLIGWAISVGVTQSTKFWMPVRWEPRLREDIARATAVLSAFFPALAYYISQGGNPFYVALTAVGAGLWSPLAFALLQAGLKRWAPGLADVFSADVRHSGSGFRQENRP